MPPTSLDKLLKLTGDGILLTVKVSPKSHHDAVKGVVELPHDRIGLAVHVSPPAADGAANDAVIAVLAELFKVPRSCLQIKSGTTSRIKTIRIKGDPFALQTKVGESLRKLLSLR